MIKKYKKKNSIDNTNTIYSDSVSKELIVQIKYFDKEIDKIKNIKKGDLID